MHQKHPPANIAVWVCALAGEFNKLAIEEAMRKKAVLVIWNYPWEVFLLDFQNLLRYFSGNSMNRITQACDMAGRVFNN
jgi:hypothetical protein